VVEDGRQAVEREEGNHKVPRLHLLQVRVGRDLVSPREMSLIQCDLDDSFNDFSSDGEDLEVVTRRMFKLKNVTYPLRL
jgi:hypothetical protein